MIIEREYVPFPGGRALADLAYRNDGAGANLLVAGRERDGLVRREPRPNHGRILEICPTDEGTRRFRAAQPFIHQLEARTTDGLAPRDVRTVKGWLVDSARILRP